MRVSRSLFASVLFGALASLLPVAPAQAALERCRIYLETPPLFVEHPNEQTRREVHARLVRALPKREEVIDTFNVFAWETWAVSPHTHDQDAKGVFSGKTVIEGRSTQKFVFDRIASSSLRIIWDEERARFVFHLAGREWLYLYPKTLNNYEDAGSERRPMRPKSRVVRLNTVAEFADGSDTPVFFEIEFHQVYGTRGPSRIWTARLELESLGRDGAEAHRLFVSGVL